MDYLRYYWNALLPLLGIIGFTLGGHWVWLGFGVFPLVGIADAFSPQDYAPRRISNAAAADLVLYLHAVLMVTLYVAFFWRIGTGFGLGGVAEVSGWLGAMASLVVINVLPNVGIAHELLHRKQPIDKFCARVLFATLAGGYSRDIGHVATHHLHFDTRQDTDTARRGENVYAFIWRCVRDVTIETFAAERRRMNARGRSTWSLHNQTAQGTIFVFVMLGVALGTGGIAGMAAIAAAFVLSRVVGEGLNYVQHYGLVRDIEGPIDEQHTWNHLSAVTRVVGLEITNHVDHHRDPNMPYYNLQPRPEGPQMRNILGWGVAAFIPPLWNRMIQPHLRNWDLHHATPVERGIAAEANRNAGWPDWLSAESGEAGLASAN